MVFNWLFGSGTEAPSSPTGSEEKKDDDEERKEDPQGPDTPQNRTRTGERTIALTPENGQLVLELMEDERRIGMHVGTPEGIWNTLLIGRAVEANALTLDVPSVASPSARAVAARAAAASPAILSPISTSSSGTARLADNSASRPQAAPAVRPARTSNRALIFDANVTLGGRRGREPPNVEDARETSRARTTVPWTLAELQARAQALPPFATLNLAVSEEYTWADFFSEDGCTPIMAKLDVKGRTEGIKRLVDTQADHVTSLNIDHLAAMRLSLSEYIGSGRHSRRVKWSAIVRYLRDNSRRLPTDPVWTNGDIRRIMVGDRVRIETLILLRNHSLGYD